MILMFVKLAKMRHNVRMLGDYGMMKSLPILKKKRELGIGR